MSRAQDILREIEAITERLIRFGISDAQKHPAMREVAGGITEIDVSGGVVSGLGYGGRSYRKVYDEIEAAKAYNVRLLDGGLLLLQYAFRGTTLLRHRLTFWASPSLESFQNEPELYETDELYLDFIDPSVVPFPIRFDFGLEEAANVPIHHPRSHLTLGQYQNCRIPVSAPLSPATFVDFVLRNFYSSAYKRFASVSGTIPTHFETCLFEEEKAIPHMLIAGKYSGNFATRTLGTLMRRKS